jgi:hypothetical protein
MKKSIVSYFVLAAISLLSMGTVISDAFAGEKEDVVLSDCSPTAVAGAYAGYAFCVGAGLTGKEINTCINNPSQCFGPSNELRKMFCAAGLFGGCPKPPTPAQLIRVLPYRGGCLAIFDNGMYLSPDCQHLRGEAPPTQNAWKADQPYYKYVQGTVIFDDCVITAFSGGGIYKSCDGLNLGGVPIGTNTVKLYQGQKIRLMKVINYRGKPVVAYVFEDGYQYCDPTGDHPGGDDPRVTRCQP